MVLEGVPGARCCKATVCLPIPQANTRAHTTHTHTRTGIAHPHHSSVESNPSLGGSFIHGPQTEDSVAGGKVLRIPEARSVVQCPVVWNRAPRPDSIECRVCQPGQPQTDGPSFRVMPAVLCCRPPKLCDSSVSQSVCQSGQSEPAFCRAELSSVACIIVFGAGMVFVTMPAGRESNGGRRQWHALLWPCGSWMAWLSWRLAPRHAIS